MAPMEKLSGLTDEQIHGISCRIADAFYNKYFTELGCTELTKIFCANDNRCYGNLPGIEFRRSGTLGTGADRCDFYLGKV